MVIYRLASGTQRNLSFFLATNILRELEPEQYLAVLADFFPKEMAEVTALPDGDVADLVEFCFGDIDRYRVYFFSTETPNCRRADVHAEFGRAGASTLSLLIERGCIEEGPDGELIGQLHAACHWPEVVIKTVARHNIRLLSLMNPGTHLRVWYSGLNGDGLRRYYDLHDEFLQSVTDLGKDKNFKGPILVTSTVAMGPIETSKGEQK
jgi:hypothetical protein